VLRPVWLLLLLVVLPQPLVWLLLLLVVPLPHPALLLPGEVRLLVVPQLRLLLVLRPLLEALLLLLLVQHRLSVLQLNQNIKY
jgi:hypothetical protein